MNEHFYDTISEHNRSNFSLNFLLIELKDKVINKTEDKINTESETQQCNNQQNNIYSCFDFYKRISRYL